MAKINPLQKLTTQKDFLIPVWFSNEIQTSYIRQLSRHFRAISRNIAKIDPALYRPVIKADLVDRIAGIQQGITNCVREYLKGHPTIAYALFEEMMAKYKVDKELCTIYQVQVPRNKKFYRTQVIHADIPAGKLNTEKIEYKKSPLDLFHSPYELRRQVATNRFSISGFPCLYLSDDLHTSYSEIFPQKGRHAPFYSVALESVRPMYFIDLSEDKLFGNKDLYGGITAKAKEKDKKFDVTGMVDYMGIYQLIIASHTKIKYKPRYPSEHYHFKAEYIVPQILLQWMRLNSGYQAVDGIRYKSCTGGTRFPRIAHYNYVLPAHQGLEKGFCPKLLHYFKASPVYGFYHESKAKRSKTFLKNIQHILSAEKSCLLIAEGK